MQMLSPENLFQDCTYLDAEWAKRISHHCLEHGTIAIIDEDSEFGHHVWHTLDLCTGQVLKKPIAQRFLQIESPTPSEATMEREIVAFLRSIDRHPRRQVRCGTGIADIVTDAAVYEVERVLSRQTLFTAIGQVLIYRQSIDPHLRAVVIGAVPLGGIDRRILDAAAAFDVEIMPWPQKGEGYAH